MTLRPSHEGSGTTLAYITELIDGSFFGESALTTEENTDMAGTPPRNRAESVPRGGATTSVSEVAVRRPRLTPSPPQSEGSLPDLRTTSEGDETQSVRCHTRKHSSLILYTPRQNSEKSVIRDNYRIGFCRRALIHSRCHFSIKCHLVKYYSLFYQTLRVISKRFNFRPRITPKRDAGT